MRSLSNDTKPAMLFVFGSMPAATNADASSVSKRPSNNCCAWAALAPRSAKPWPVNSPRMPRSHSRSKPARSGSFGAYVLSRLPGLVFRIPNNRIAMATFCGDTTSVPPASILPTLSINSLAPCDTIPISAYVRIARSAPAGSALNNISNKCGWSLSEPAGACKTPSRIRASTWLESDSRSLSVQLCGARLLAT